MYVANVKISLFAVYICIYTDERERDRQTDRDKDRDRERQIKIYFEE